MKISAAVKSHMALLIVALVLGLGTVPSLAQGASVNTWRNDNGRTGQNSLESILKTTNVTQNQFGLLCKLNPGSLSGYSGTLWSGQIFGQPLVVADSSGTGMTVYVVTMDNVVFSIYIPNGWSKTNCATSGTSHLTINAVDLDTTCGLNNEYPADCCQLGGSAGNCPTINPTVGILGTPVISDGTLWVVTESQSGQPNT